MEDENKHKDEDEVAKIFLFAQDMQPCILSNIHA